MLIEVLRIESGGLFVAAVMAFGLCISMWCLLLGRWIIPCKRWHLRMPVGALGIAILWGYFVSLPVRFSRLFDLPTLPFLLAWVMSAIIWASSLAAFKLIGRDDTSADWLLRGCWWVLHLCYMALGYWGNVMVAVLASSLAGTEESAVFIKGWKTVGLCTAFGASVIFLCLGGIPPMCLLDPKGRKQVPLHMGALWFVSGWLSLIGVGAEEVASRAFPGLFHCQVSVSASKVCLFATMLTLLWRMRPLSTAKL